MATDGLPLDLFSPERLLGLEDRRYTAVQVSEKAGLGLDDTRRLWRAMGFVLIPDEDVYFTEQDLDILVRLRDFIEAGLADLELVLGITRVMSQSIARITDAEADAIRHRLTAEPDLASRVLGRPESELAAEVFEPLERFLVYVWRRQMLGALHRLQAAAPEEGGASLAVGFADIVGFTRLSRQLDENELALLIEGFEASAQEIATEIGVRIVKTIGDEIMFVSPEPRAAAEMGLRLAEKEGDGETQPEVRVGVAFGEVASHHGDHFGPTVNLASRAAGAAHPGTVLVSEDVAEALGEETFVTKPIPRRRLKGLGPTELYVLRRSTRA